MGKPLELKVSDLPPHLRAHARALAGWDEPEAPQPPTKPAKTPPRRKEPQPTATDTPVWRQWAHVVLAVLATVAWFTMG